MLSLPDFKEKRIILFFSKDGDKISFKNDNIIIKDCNNKIKCQYTCYKLFILFVIGAFDITSGLVERANRFGFTIIFMNYGFKVYATINSRMEGNTLLREKQYLNENSNEIAKKIVINKIKNQCQILRKIRKKDNDMKKTIGILDGYVLKLQNDLFKETEEIMGVEGIAAKQYFKQLYKDFDWNGRQPRVKRDEINLLLEVIANVYGFDIYKGILHKEFFKRKSLICDFIEPFRPIIDYKIRKMKSLGQIDINDFINENGRFRIEWKNNSKYMNLFIEEINQHKEIIFSYIQNFYRWYMKGANIEKYPEVLLEVK